LSFRFGNKVTDDVIDYDVAIVGGGPAGLSSAIRLKQLAKKTGKELTVCLIEKGKQIGSHSISGLVLDPRALNELFPKIKKEEIPNIEKAKLQDVVYHFISKNRRLRIPSILHPKQLNNDKNYLISLGHLTEWLATKAEELGVHIFPENAGKEVLYDKNGDVCGVRTGERGILKTGKKGEMYMPGMDI